MSAVQAMSTFTLRNYQSDASDAAVTYLRAKSDRDGLLILPTGSGKSLVIADVVNRLDDACLVLQPSKEILQQNFTKLMHYGFRPAVYSASLGKKQISGAVTLATIGSIIPNRASGELADAFQRRTAEALDRFSHIKYVLIDECFPAGTLIDGRPIESLRPGESVRSVNHTTGKIETRSIRAVSKRRYSGEFVRVETTDGRSFICTGNHPIHTNEDGYVPAALLNIQRHTLTTDTYEQKKDLDLPGLWAGMQAALPRPYLHLLQREMQSGETGTEERNGDIAVRAVRGADNNSRRETAVLEEGWPSVLLDRMLQESPECCLYYQRPGRPLDRSVATACICANEGEESHASRRERRKDDGFHEGTDLYWARREWSDNETAGGSPFRDWTSDGVFGGNRGGSWPIRVGSALLQGRSGGALFPSSDRGRREDAQVEAVAISGSTQDGNLGRARLVSVEVYKRGDRSRPAEMRGDGRVYNLDVEGNHNYFANGFLVHNCHLVSAKTGMYKQFFDVMKPLGVRVIGLTATPYRLSSSMEGPTLKFLTRTQPRLFDDVVYYVQNGQLFKDGHLAKLEYHQIKGFDRTKLQANSTGAEYTDESVKQHFRDLNFADKLQRVVERLLVIERKGVLVFTRFVEESRQLAEKIPGAAVVSAETPAPERDRILREFRAGKIRVVANCGVLTVGFDYPELDTVVLARPTLSLSLFYQKVGRAIRPHPSKAYAMIVDMVGLVEQFGKVEDLRIECDHRKLYYVASGGKQLTNVVFNNKR